jgi:hypothetical protein
VYILNRRVWIEPGTQYLLACPESPANRHPPAPPVSSSPMPCIRFKSTHITLPPVFASQQNTPRTDTHRMPAAHRAHQSSPGTRQSQSPRHHKPSSRNAHRPWGKRPARQFNGGAGYPWEMTGTTKIRGLSRIHLIVIASATGECVGAARFLSACPGASVLPMVRPSRGPMPGWLPRRAVLGLRMIEWEAKASVVLDLWRPKALPE